MEEALLKTTLIMKYCATIVLVTKILQVVICSLINIPYVSIVCLTTKSLLLQERGRKIQLTFIRFSKFFALFYNSLSLMSLLDKFCEVHLWPNKDIA